MEFSVTQGCFSSEAEALADIEARGWKAMVIDFPDETNEFHWHDFDSVVFILEGTLQSQLQDGTILTIGPGAKLEAPARVVHREVTEAYRAVAGFSCRVRDMSQPVNKPASSLV
jgi:quercetin dioxygenase-like cupin family protein